MPKYKIFICYKSEKIHYVKKLYEGLSRGKGSRKFDIFVDYLIPLGEDYEELIEKNLRTTDVAIVLLCKELFESKYIMERELPMMFRRKLLDKDFILLPLLLEDVQENDLTTEEQKQHLKMLKKYQWYRPFNRDFGMTPYNKTVLYGKIVNQPEERLNTYHDKLVDKLNEQLKKKRNDTFINNSNLNLNYTPETTESKVWIPIIRLFVIALVIFFSAIYIEDKMQQKRIQESIIFLERSSPIDIYRQNIRAEYEHSQDSIYNVYSNMRKKIKPQYIENNPSSNMESMDIPIQNISTSYNKNIPKSYSYVEDNFKPKGRPTESNTLQNASILEDKDFMSYCKNIKMFYKNKLIGYKTQKRLVISPRYKDGRNFCDCYTAVKTRDGKMKIIDYQNNNISINLDFYAIREFHEGLAGVFADKDNFIGFINPKGFLTIDLRKIINKKCINATHFNKKIAVLQMESGEEWKINDKGKIITRN